MPISPSGFPRSASISPRLQVAATTASTNADVLTAAAADPDEWPHLSVLLTDDQRSGRGRQGRSWVAPSGTSLAISIVLRPGPIPASSRGWIPLIAGAAMARAVTAELGVAGVAQLKWPNDVLVDGKKISGILTEASGTDPDLIVVGIGVNTVMEPVDLPVDTATSFLILGAEADPDRLLERVLSELRDRTAAFAVADGDAEHAGVAAEVASLCTTLGHEVTVALPDGSRLNGRADRLDDTGRLVVVSAAAGETAVAAGDVVQVR